jgi:hypothetical protein
MLGQRGDGTVGLMMRQCDGRCGGTTPGTGGLGQLLGTGTLESDKNVVELDMRQTY